ncbi:CYTH domain-containing protein [Amphibacillus jilinensis]|uniref:CYTH domain-containing protein n=1 Tax=Amphibacillus jilinensis TaxID=1216008 RepID=UPI0003025DC8|nr:CYTH domain-containing protein [Amphibacillus jilinensis]
MSQEIEIECKLLLTEEEYRSLLDYLNCSTVRPTEQINYYFETPKFNLKNKGAALRIRYKDDQFILTLKQPHPDGLLETHDYLSKQQAENWLNNQPTSTPAIESELINLGVHVNQLHYGGALVTERIEIEYHGALVVADISKYNNQIDYELEVEARTRQIAESVMDELINTLSLEVKPTPNKIERFYQSLHL